MFAQNGELIGSPLHSKVNEHFGEGGNAVFGVFGACLRNVCPYRIFTLGTSWLVKDRLSYHPVGDGIWADVTGKGKFNKNDK